jgi:hypothetical protein
MPVFMASAAVLLGEGESRSLGAAGTVTALAGDRAMRTAQRKARLLVLLQGETGHAETTHGMTGLTIAGLASIGRDVSLELPLMLILVTVRASSKARGEFDAFPSTMVTLPARNHDMLARERKPRAVVERHRFEPGQGDTGQGG